jgi:heterodisulfide reductase subunit A-like polyferredoxin
MAEESGRYLIEFKDILTERGHVPELSVEERKGNFEEVELGFTQEMAVAEAKRCLSCRRCLGCGLCLAECPHRAVEFEEGEETLELEVDWIVAAPAAVKSVAPGAEEFVRGKPANVVSLPGFERILNEKGPYGGWLIRPYDGEIPKRIAFVVPPSGGAANSLEPAVRAIEEAAKKIEGLEAALFLPETVSDQGVEERVGELPGFSLRRAGVRGLAECGESGNISVEVGEGPSQPARREEFDMAVVLTGPEMPASLRDVVRMLGLKTDGGGFMETDPLTLTETSLAGVFLVGCAFHSR